MAAVLATRGVRTHEDLFRAEAEGDIRNVEGILKITDIRVRYTLKVSPRREEDARWAFGHYIEKCPAAQSVTGCINIGHDLNIEAG
jgi:uncharacterized OsmC-like protein